MRLLIIILMYAISIVLMSDFAFIEDWIHRVGGVLFFMAMCVSVYRVCVLGMNN